MIYAKVGKMNDKYKDLISLGEYEAFIGQLEGLREVGYETASFKSDKYEFYFDLESMKCVKYRSLDSDKWENENEELLYESVYIIILSLKEKETDGFHMED